MQPLDSDQHRMLAGSRPAIGRRAELSLHDVRQTRRRAAAGFFARARGAAVSDCPARANMPDGASQRESNRPEMMCASTLRNSWRVYEIAGATVTNRTDTNPPADIQLGFHHRFEFRPPSLHLGA
jgi:hypothetical protein